MQPSLTASVYRKAGSEVSNWRHLSLRKVAWRQGIPREAIQSGSCFVQSHAACTTCLGKVSNCLHRRPASKSESWSLPALLHSWSL